MKRGMAQQVVLAILEGATVKEAAQRYGVRYGTALKQFDRYCAKRIEMGNPLPPHHVPQVRRNYTPEGKRKWEIKAVEKRQTPQTYIGQHNPHIPRSVGPYILDQAREAYREFDSGRVHEAALRLHRLSRYVKQCAKHVDKMKAGEA